mmetsp:Transcript_62195/g.170890  ORF Transcript_62195/g.170890 Transcript_62195/m.170890 type:complete len:132 (-) Transcript_62195:17-412(-)
MRIGRRRLAKGAEGSCGKPKSKGCAKSEEARAASAAWFGVSPRIFSCLCDPMRVGRRGRNIVYVESQGRWPTRWIVPQRRSAQAERHAVGRALRTGPGLEGLRARSQSCDRLIVLGAVRALMAFISTDRVV